MIRRWVKGLGRRMQQGLRVLGLPVRACLWVRRGCRFVLVLLLLLGCLSCTALGLLVRQATAGEPGSDVMLAIDNSNSMFDKNGVGSDPELRRIEAAQMFISYRGVDSGSSSHRLGVIFFGGEAKEVVPLTPLTSDDERSKMMSLIADPQRMEWTDPAAALTLSRKALLSSGQQGRERAVVLLTDGKPEWDHDPTPEESRAVIDDLRRIGDQYAEDGIDLFVILLANEATDADPEIGTTYVPLWRSITETTGGRFYQVRRADDLFTIYHDILLTLSATESAGPVVDTMLEGTPQQETVVIEPNLARVTYLVRLSSTDVAATIHRPNGKRLKLDDPDVRHAGWGTTAIWGVTRPQSGEWQVRMGGQGSVTVWKDFLPLPQQERVSDPSPTPLPPSPTPTVTSSPTPVPRLVVRDWPETAFVGRPVQVSASLQPEPTGQATYWAAWQLDGAEVASGRLLDDGREGDARAGDGRYGALITPPTTGTLFLQAWSEVEDREIASWEGRLHVEPYPTLRLISPEDGETWHVDDPVSVATRWHAGEMAVGTEDLLTVTLCPADETGCRIFTGTVGHPLEMYAPSDAGSYTLTAEALVNLPGASSVQATATRSIVVQRPVPGWLWVAGTGAFAVIVGGWWVYRYRRGLPRLAGRLRVLTAPSEYTGPTLTDLSSLNQRSIELGGEGAALELPPEGAPWASIQALADESGMELSPCNGRLIRVNGYELTGPHLLSDGDRIAIDGATLRYEYLHYGL